jgi:hypothetical protein
MTAHRHTRQQLQRAAEELVESVMEEEAIMVNPDSDATLQFSALAARAPSRRVANLPADVAAQVPTLLSLSASGPGERALGKPTRTEAAWGGVAKWWVEGCCDTPLWAQQTSEAGGCGLRRWRTSPHWRTRSKTRWTRWSSRRPCWC